MAACWGWLTEPRERKSGNLHLRWPGRERRGWRPAERCPRRNSRGGRLLARPGLTRESGHCSPSPSSPGRAAAPEATAKRPSASSSRVTDSAYLNAYRARNSGVPAWGLSSDASEGFPPAEGVSGSGAGTLSVGIDPWSPSRELRHSPPSPLSRPSAPSRLERSGGSESPNPSRGSLSSKAASRRREAEGMVRRPTGASGSSSGGSGSCWW